MALNSYKKLLNYQYLITPWHKRGRICVQFLIISKILYLPIFFCYNLMIPGLKGLNPHELAQMWVNVLETRQNMSLKVGRKHHDMRIFCRIVGVRST